MWAEHPHRTGDDVAEAKALFLRLERILNQWHLQHQLILVALEPRSDHWRNAMEPTSGALTGCRILVIESEYFLAEDLKLALMEQGAVVLGPVPTLKQAFALVQGHDRIDGAVLDLNLQGERACPFVDVLEIQQVPFVFTTGYGPEFIPARFRHAPRWEKPVDPQALAKALPDLIHCP